MTSTLSANNKARNNFMTNFLIKLKSNKKIFIVISILQLISLPLLFTMTVIRSVTSDSSISIDIYGVIAIFGLIGATLAGIIIAMGNFSYLYRKTDVDMFYSLPLNTKQRFFSDYLSGLAVYAVPYICSCIITLIIHFVSLGLFKEWQEYVGIGFSETILKAMLCGLLVMIMLYSFSILIISCCGSIFESVIYILLGNIIVPLTIADGAYSMFANLYGVNLDTTTLNLVSYTSPFGGAIAAFGILDRSFANSLSSYWKWLCIYVIITAIIFIGSYFLYKNRKAEDVSKPFVYKAFYYIVITAITFCIGCIIPASNDNSYIAPVIIMTAIIYLIFEVVTNRGFKKIYLSAIRYVVTMAAVIAIPYIVTATEGFGIVYNIPKTSSISSVTINLPTEGTIWGNDSTEVTIDNPDVIDDIIAVHEDIIGKYKNDENYRAYVSNRGYIYEQDYNQDYIANKSYYFNDDIPVFHTSIDYHLKNGSVSSKTYNLTNEEQLMLKSIFQEKEYAEAKAHELYSYALGSLVSMDVYNKYNLYDNTFAIDNNFGNKLLAAYQKDLESQDVDYVFNEDIYAYLFTTSFPVYETFDNTIELLKEYGYTPNGIKAEIESYRKLNEPRVDLESITANVFLFTPEQYQSFGGDQYTATYSSFVITNTDVHQIDLFGGEDIDEDIIKLFEIARANAVIEDDCYVMIFNEKRYVIPKEYSKLAEKVLKENTIYTTMNIESMLENSDDRILDGKQKYLDAYNYLVAINVSENTGYTDEYSKYYD